MDSEDDFEQKLKGGQELSHVGYLSEGKRTFQERTYISR